HRAAEVPAMPVPGGSIVGEHFKQVAWHLVANAFAHPCRVAVLRIARGIVGVAAAYLPRRRQRPADLNVDTLAFDFARCARARYGSACRAVFVVRNRAIALLDLI